MLQRGIRNSKSSFFLWIEIVLAMFMAFQMPVLFIFFEMTESNKSLVTHLTKGGLLCDFFSKLSYVPGALPLSILILMMELGFMNKSSPPS